MTTHDDPLIHREFLKGEAWELFDHIQTDQQKRLPRPLLEQPVAEDAPRVVLPAPETFTLGMAPLLELIRQRQSRRKYTEEALTLEELAFLLWATQGVRKIFRDNVALFRTVPSAGARHPFETYLVISRVNGVEPGLYRYLSLEHALVFVRAEDTLPEQAAKACFNQDFVAQAAVTFFWTAVPYRTEWRYSVVSPKLVALDAGHVCQNLYLAAGAIGAGTCAIAAYDQKLSDALLDVDGKDEFVVYIAPVGKVPGEEPED